VGRLVGHRSHPNVVSLYTMWNEPVPGPYAYRTLVGLYQEGARGNLLDYAIQRPDGRRLRSRRCKLLACNIASALRSFHNCSIIHAGIRPRNIYIDENRVALVGESRKVELDSLRYRYPNASVSLCTRARPSL
jgi:serine/threonine protein kinase